jgi:hypothetical protein
MQIDTPAKAILFSTVRLEIETQGERSYGTAVMYRRGTSAHDVFFVTCRHVVEGSLRGHLFFTRASRRTAAVGDRVQLTIEDFETKWFFHPNDNIDIAIAPFSIGQRNPQERIPVYFQALDKAALPTAQILRGFDAIEEVVFIGYPAGYYDRVNLLPIARRGITASPIYLDYNGRQEFLIDGAVYFGSSGGPVFIIRPLSALEQLRTLRKYRFIFLGIVSELWRATFTGETSFIHPIATSEGVASARLLNLGVVLKAHLIEETIDAYQQGASSTLNQ